MRRIEATPQSETVRPSSRAGVSQRGTRSSSAGPPTAAAHGYRSWVVAADALGVLLPVVAAYAHAGQPHGPAAACVATASWLAIRTGRGRYASRALGESRGLVAAARDWLTLCGLLAAVRVLTEGDAPVSTVLLALAPALLVSGTAATCVHRHLTVQRRHAQAVRRVLVVGEPGSVDAVTGRLAARTDHAYVVVGAVPVGAGTPGSGLPVGGRLSAVASNLDGTTVLASARRQDADLILAVPGSLLTGERLRRLGWAVHDAGLPLAVTSGLTDVTASRIRVANAAGLNVLHLAPPQRTGPQVLIKAVLDRVAAALGLLLLGPLLALLVLAVRLDSPGPALFRQTRVGRHGAPFTMWKLRTMVGDAERLRPELAEDNDHRSGPLFKMRQDPRVTRVGRWLRRTSLDELPQLVNVVRGEMSLVGPRPPLPEEVARYDAEALRRLSVHPGMSGPWQISGRSELSWDESLALDLSYVDNWSVTGDLDILARTARAVADGRGAY